LTDKSITSYDNEWNNNRAGYTYQNATPYKDGFYRIAEQKQFDFQLGTGNHGLVTAMRDVFNNEATVSFDSYGFLPVQVTDPIGMQTAAKYNYRVLQANQVTDANDNETAFAFSPLGLLKATAVMGKAAANEGDTLTDPGTKLEYDFNAFCIAKQPIWVKTIRREFHINDPNGNNDTITSIEYSDGFGRLLQSRSRTEDVIYASDHSPMGDSGLPEDQSAQNADAVGTIKGAMDPDNVVVNGFKIYNNKGKVVEQYEPYFESGYAYTAPVKTGQKIRLFYDALGRPTQTLNPDGTAQLSVYGIPLTLSSPTQQSSGRFTTNYTPTPWENYAYDANDLGGDTHPMESSSYSSHWNTPESNEIDALSRTIKTTQRPDSTPANDIVMQYEYDIQGRLTKVTDPLDRVNFTYLYATAAIPKEEEEEQIPPEAEALKIVHLDSGTKSQVFDARAQLIEQQDAKNNRFYALFDYQGKPLKVWMQESGQGIRLSEQYSYGLSSDKDSNRFGKLSLLLDAAGQEEYLNYDFKGNLLQKQRRVIRDTFLSNPEKFAIDWEQGTPDDFLDTQIFESKQEYDALNRIKKLILPQDVNGENNTVTPLYNRAGALEKVTLNGEEYVKEIAYNAKGQRLLITFGNEVMNRYTYDPKNFRLLRMKAEKYTFSENATERTYSYNSGTNRQDLGYEYDLNGNILKKKNRTPDSGISGTTLGVDGLDNEYTYDAISRLLTATGRESDANNESYRWAEAPVAGSPNASNTQSYTRNYSYDKVGNIQTLQQTGSNAFTRTFNYTDNTLNDITVSSTPTPFSYDANGNLITSGSSRFYEWNEKDELSFFKIDAGGGPSVYAHYLYDSGGNRLKKIVWDQQGNKEVTVYVDGIFEYRLKQEDSTDKEQNIVHILDDTARIAQVRIGTAFNDDIAEEVHYVLDDHLGSSTTRLNNSGGVIDRQEFYPFGDASLRTYSFKRYRYAGKEKDSESGLYYFGQRFYAPWLCRFVSVDPLAAQYAHLTPYNNAGNKVINSVDIDGLQGSNEATSEGVNSGNAEFDKEANAAIDTFGNKEGFTLDIEVHNVDGQFRNGSITVSNSEKSVTGDFTPEGGFTFSEAAESGGILGASKAAFDIGNDLSIRNNDYVKPYQNDLKKYNLSPTKDNKAAAAVNRNNNLAKVRDKISPIGKAASEGKKSFANSVKVTEEIAFGDKKLGQNTNRGFDKLIPYRNSFKALGIIGGVYAANESINRIADSGFDIGVIASEAGGWTGAYMVGAMAGAMAATLVAAVAAPLVIAAVTVIAAGIAGAALGYYLGSGQATKDFMNWYNK